MSGLTDTGTIDLLSDLTKDSGEQVDAVTYVTAAIFNAVAMPKGMPDFQRVEIERRADEAREAAAEAGFVMASPADLVDGKTREERQKDAAEKSRDSLAALGAQEERRRREQEWDASRIAVGGIAMSGADWDQALDLLSDTKMRERLIQSMTRAKGWSKDRAEKAADDALTLAQIAQKKKDGTITAADEAKAEDIARRNPDAVVMVKEATRLKIDRGYGADVKSGSAASFLSGDIDVAATERQSVIKAVATTITLGDDPAFASAPNVASHFAAARDEATAKPSMESVKPVSPQMVAQLDISGPF